VGTARYRTDETFSGQEGHNDTSDELNHLLWHRYCSTLQKVAGFRFAGGLQTQYAVFGKVESPQNRSRMNCAVLVFLAGIGDKQLQSMPV
jgi:hypothetical protein